MKILYVFSTGSREAGAGSAARAIRDRAAVAAWPLLPLRCAFPFAMKSSIQFNIGEQTVQSAFAAHARLLVAAERAGWIEFVVGVGPNDAGADFAGDFEDFGAFVRPDAAG